MTTRLVLTLALALLLAPAAHAQDARAALQSAARALEPTV